MAALNACVAVITIIGMICVAWGYRHALRNRGTATWHFAMSMATLAGSMGLRWLYWDVIWTTLRNRAPDLASALSAAHGGTSINIVFNLMVLAAIYHSLKARWLLLPEKDRARWHWWSAWSHPDGIYFLRRR